MSNPEGNRAQQFARRHQEFLVLWAEGRHPLEIAHRLGLSPSQLDRHIRRAVEEQVPLPKTTYSCVVWEDLPPVLKKLLPCDNKEALVKAKREDDSLVLTLIAETVHDQEHDAASMQGDSPDVGKLATVIARPKQEAQ